MLPSDPCLIIEHWILKTEHNKHINSENNEIDAITKKDTNCWENQLEKIISSSP